MSTVVLVGTSRPKSRTLGVALQAAEAVGERVGATGGTEVADLSVPAPDLLSAVPVHRP